MMISKTALASIVVSLVAPTLGGCASEETANTSPPTAITSAVDTTSLVASGNAIPQNITNGSLWDLEGDTPNPLANPQTLVFLPLEAKYTSPNGNGWRHEYKIKSALRVAMTETYEEFTALVKVEMSDGGKTIVAQHHGGGLGTIMKVYVSDTDENGFTDSNAKNGVFDVYVRLKDTSGDEDKFTLGTMRSGDSFKLHVINNYGKVSVSALGNSFGMQVLNSSDSYLKFGNYLQSQNPIGNVKCGTPGNSSSFEQCYSSLGITEAKVSMTDVSYKRVNR